MVNIAELRQIEKRLRMLCSNKPVVSQEIDERHSTPKKVNAEYRTKAALSIEIRAYQKETDRSYTENFLGDSPILFCDPKESSNPTFVILGKSEAYRCSCYEWDTLPLLNLTRKGKQIRITAIQVSDNAITLTTRAEYKEIQFDVCTGLKYP